MSVQTPVEPVASDPDQPPIALFHGFLETTALWHACDTRLWAGHDVYALPLPGHAPAQPDMAMHHALADDRFIDAYAERLAQLRPGHRWRLVGHSTGALIALALARRAPEIVRDLCAVAPLFSGAVCGRNLQGALVRIPVLGPLSFRWLVESWLRDDAAFLAGVRTVTTGLEEGADGLRVMRAELAACPPDDLYRFGCWIGRQNLAAHLQSIACPIHAIICAADPVVQPRHQLALISSTPQAFAVMLTCGHLPMFERPAAFARAFAAWRAGSHADDSDSDEIPIHPPRKVVANAAVHAA